MPQNSIKTVLKNSLMTEIANLTLMFYEPLA
jgi:hypothetical protein